MADRGSVTGTEARKAVPFHDTLEALSDPAFARVHLGNQTDWFAFGTMERNVRRSLNVDMLSGNKVRRRKSRPWPEAAVENERASPRAKDGRLERKRRTCWHDSVFRHLKLCDPHFGIDAGSVELAEEGGRSCLGLARGAADGDGVPGRLLLRCRVGPRLDDLHVVQLWGRAIASAVSCEPTDEFGVDEGGRDAPRGR